MVLPPSFSRKMGEIETVEAEKMGWIYLPRGTFYPTFPYINSSGTFKFEPHHLSCTQPMKSDTQTHKHRQMATYDTWLAPHSDHLIFTLETQFFSEKNITGFIRAHSK